ncbi:hypothetical protein DEU56DRAFT_561936 [Suillus clintonianus]|uniref:uncharacterized protein n=1 Tax=Suillus clintonianus TaxID=1904413 RepID=UPI001B860CD0|nr:uncharacterized protein DEU56DRAFT_561936 [Suillus clintonianus]KAG2125785.1 hypothetical protein DEU56DRAFT_561936 [Suillus clintonianus]
MQLYRNTQRYQRPVKQSKIASQRQYRVKEGDGFQELRDVIHSVSGETPQTRRETLKAGILVSKCVLPCVLIPCTAAELLKQFFGENGSISRHEPPLESSSESPYEAEQGPHTSYERLLVPDGETCTNTIAPWTENVSPTSERSATSTMLEYYSGYPQEEAQCMVGCGGDWNLVQPTPSQFSFSTQWNDLSFVHMNIDQVPFYVEGVELN